MDETNSEGFLGVSTQEIHVAIAEPWVCDEAFPRGGPAEGRRTIPLGEELRAQLVSPCRLASTHGCGARCPRGREGTPDCAWHHAGVGFPIRSLCPLSHRWGSCIVPACLRRTASSEWQTSNCRRNRFQLFCKSARGEATRSISASRPWRISAMRGMTRRCPMRLPQKRFSIRSGCL